MTQRFITDPSGLGRGYPIIAASSEQFSHADAVFINSSGFLEVADATGKVLGYYVGQGETMSATNETVAKVCPDYVYAEDVEMAYGADQACTQTDIGAYADFGTVTTGAQELNLTAGATGTFLVLGFDPDGDGTTTLTVVTVAEPQKSAFAQA
jgi:hypothetical protein